jgi:uncharacterized protein (TIGR03083 family)
VTTPRATVGQYLDAYAALRERVAGVVDANGWGAAVPACPGWDVRDVLAHLTGLCEDWVDHRLGGYASAAWTASQVSRYATSTGAQLLQRWAELAEQFTRLEEDAVMGPPVRWAFGDAVIHEADIRGAVSAGRVPYDAVLLGMHGSIARWRDVLANAGLSLVVRPPDAREWSLLTAQDHEVVFVAPPLYELFRALAGRRSREQVRAWSWSRDSQPFIAAGLPYPFEWATTRIED